jgi:hypothetical protein
MAMLAFRRRCLNTSHAYAPVHAPARTPVRVRPPHLRAGADLIGILDGVATTAHIAASGVTAFVMVYCSMNWWACVQERMAMEDSSDDDDAHPS